MKVRIISSRPKEPTDKSIDDMIGREFEVVTDGLESHNDGIYISCRRDPRGYFIYNDEYEIVEDGESA